MPFSRMNLSTCSVTTQYYADNKHPVVLGYVKTRLSYSRLLAALIYKQSYQCLLLDSTLVCL